MIAFMMRQARNHQRSARHLRRKKGIMSLIKGSPHLSGRAKSRLYCKLQMWMWRKRKGKCRFWQSQAKKEACRIGLSPCLNVKMQSRKNKGRDPMPQVPNYGGDAGGLEGSSRGKRGLSKSREILNSTCSSQNPVVDTVVSAGDSSQTLTSQRTNTLTESSKLSHTFKPPLRLDSNTCGLNTNSLEKRTITVCQILDADGPSKQVTPGPGPSPDQTANGDIKENISSKVGASSLSDVSIKMLTKEVHEFLDDFYRQYGSLIPLQKTDVLRHLKRKFNTDFYESYLCRKTHIFSEVGKYRTVISQKPAPHFRVVYKKHTLTLEDLSTLANQNWLNDQVMNMYGELIMEAAHHKVHFLNSFFHRQLMNKGYDGVKRWTKQVDLFSKTFLLVPIHLEVHWCLVSADVVKKKICLYDSQGNALLKVARNILKYLMTEAKEKKQTAFENGWAVSFDEKIPQQTNENDCGVFVLEYSRCLALAKPLQFSQKDIPKIRKRIYRELCDRKLHEQ